jgi:hypothetical protein
VNQDGDEDIDHHRSLIDPSTCQTFTEVIVTDKAKARTSWHALRVNREQNRRDSKS